MAISSVFNAGEPSHALWIKSLLRQPHVCHHSLRGDLPFKVIALGYPQPADSSKRRRCLAEVTHSLHLCTTERHVHPLCVLVAVAICSIFVLHTKTEHCELWSCSVCFYKHMLNKRFSAKTIPNPQQVQLLLLHRCAFHPPPEKPPLSGLKFRSCKSS